MSPEEILWRARSVGRDLVDRIRVPLSVLPSLAEPQYIKDPEFRLTDVEIGAATRSTSPEAGAWAQRLVTRAERLVAHRMDLFDLTDLDLGSEVEWNFDHGRRLPTPLWLSSSIDYRDYSITGDCKVVWEPSRHHHLVVLARAYRVTGDERFAREVVAQLLSWMDQCPFGRGMQWRSPLEVAIRAINWIWAYDLLRDSVVFSGPVRDRFLRNLYLHIWDTGRKFSRGSSANNHLIGEAAGVFVACTYFADLPDAKRLAEESRHILEREILLQSCDDGGGREQAFGYHNFVAQFFTFAGMTARRAAVDFSERYWRRLERMLEFACRMLEGGPAPMFGDADDGYVLDLGADPRDIREVLAIGAVLFDRADLKGVADGHEEPVEWVLGREGLRRFHSLAGHAVADTLSSEAFPQAGYYLLQCGHKRDSDRVSVMFDCGELGFGALAAHGHADALSFTVRAYGEDLLVDSGTYDYFTYPEWRRYFRSTAAHNTVVVDDSDQSTMNGSFLWGHRASSQCIRWDSSDGRTTVVGEHDGYARLTDPVIHRRTLELDATSRTLKIADQIAAASEHQIALHFHLSERCSVRRLDNNAFELAVPTGVARLTIDPALRVELVAGRVEPPLGWVSRHYHQKTASTTLVASTRISGNATWTCQLAFQSPARRT
jgi:hypothetical protein